MKLTLLQRMILPTILPSKGKYEDLILKDDIVEKVKITQEEVKSFNIRTEQVGDKFQTLWEDPDKTEFEYTFTELEMNLIKRNLDNLQKNEELTDETKGLYKLFKDA